MIALPATPRGRLLAGAGAATLAAVAWLGLAAPLLDSYAQRSQTLAHQQDVLRRMQALAATLPGLQHQQQAIATLPDGLLLDTGSDLAAASALARAVSLLCGAAGVAVTSTELAPPATEGSYRRVGLRLTLAADLGPMTQVIQALVAAKPGLRLDALQLRTSGEAAGKMDASMVIYAYRPETPLARTATLATTP